MGEWFERAKAAMIAANPAIKAETIDLEGSILHAECRAVEVIGQELEWLVAELDADSYLDTATGDALSRWGADRYGVTRAGATAAVVALTISRPTGAYGSITIPAGSVVLTADGVRFALDESARLSMLVNTATVTATSVLAGVDQNVAAGTLTTFESPPRDTSIVATNATRAAGGNGAETDEDFRARCRAVYITARRGTVEAIRQGALAVPQVREAAAYEALDDIGREIGEVALVISDESGASNGTLTAAVDLSLDEYRPAGVRVLVSGAVVRLESIAYTVTWATGYGSPADALATRQAVVAVVNRLDPNGAATAALAPVSSRLYPGLIEQAVRSVRGVVGVTVTTPAGAVAPDNGQVIRTDLGRVVAS